MPHTRPMIGGRFDDCDPPRTRRRLVRIADLADVA